MTNPVESPTEYLIRKAIQDERAKILDYINDQTIRDNDGDQWDDGYVTAMDLVIDFIQETR